MHEKVAEITQAMVDKTRNVIVPVIYSVIQSGLRDDVECLLNFVKYILFHTRILKLMFVQCSCCNNTMKMCAVCDVDFLSTEILDA